MNQESGKGIIFGVLGILTLIIAIMGASLAYFTANAMSGETPIEVTAATVTISYTQGDILKATELIPATFDVVESAYTRTDTDDNGQSLQCIDGKGYQVCSTFAFYASNEAGKNPQRLVGSIKTITKEGEYFPDQEYEFANLSYTVYEIDDASGERTKINDYVTQLAASGGSTQLFYRDPVADQYEATEAIIGAGEEKHFEIVLWLNEQSSVTPDTEEDPDAGNQDFEQGLSYVGVVEIGVSGASDVITGTYVD